MVISTNAQCDRELLDSRVHMFQHPWPPGVERTRPLQQGPGYAELFVRGKLVLPSGTVAAKGHPQQPGCGGDLEHGLNTVPAVIVVGQREKAMGLGQQMCVGSNDRYCPAGAEARGHGSRMNCSLGGLFRASR